MAQENVMTKSKDARPERRKMTTLHPWRQDSDYPIACPLCYTLDVTHQTTEHRQGGGLVEETYRCNNGHRWTTSRRAENEQPLGWHLGSDEFPIPPYRIAAIHCPKCGHEAEYRGWLRGVSTCDTCGNSNEHVLSWPEDAYYGVEVDSKILWAWTRDAAIALKEFIASDNREPRDYGGHDRFLRHIPKEFLLAKHRDIAVRRLQRLLDS
jgi:hypothetical protein